MTKTKTALQKDNKPYIVAIWICGLLPVLLIVSLANHFVHIIDVVIVIVASIIAAFSISLLSPTVKKNMYGFLAPALILSTFSILFILDIWNETTSKSDSCGVGFSAGNCFLLDGFSMFVYFFIIPIFQIIATILLAINFSRKTKQK